MATSIDGQYSNYATSIDGQYSNYATSTYTTYITVSTVEIVFILHKMQGHYPVTSVV